MAKDTLFDIVNESETVETIILIKERSVRPISGATILKSSEEGVTVRVRDGDVLRIGGHFYIWIEAKKELEIQC